VHKIKWDDGRVQVCLTAGNATLSTCRDNDCTKRCPAIAGAWRSSRPPTSSSTARRWRSDAPGVVGLPCRAQRRIARRLQKEISIDQTEVSAGAAGSTMLSISSTVSNVRSWHIASFRSAAEFGRYRGMADPDDPSTRQNLWVHGL